MAANPSGKLSATSALYASSCWALLRPKSELIDGSVGFQLFADDLPITSMNFNFGDFVNVWQVHGR